MPENVHPTFEGKTPQQIFKLVKGGELSREELCHAYAAAYDEYDPEDPDHQLMHRRIKIAIAEIDQREKEEEDAVAEALKKELLAAGKDYASKNGLNPEIMSETALIEIGGMVIGAAQSDNTNPETGEDETVEIIRRDDEQMCLVTPSGEIVAFLDAPTYGGKDDRESLLKWVGEKITEAEARAAGVEAEKKVWQDKIDAIYDPQINAQRRRAKSLEWTYGPMAKQYLQEVVDAHWQEELKKKDESKRKPLRSIKLGLLKLAFTKERASIDVIIGEKAVLWLQKRGLHDAVKITEAVLKSNIPDDVKKKINEDPKSGMHFNPGGGDKFSMG
jgi:hypothetical protein